MRKKLPLAMICLYLQPIINCNQGIKPRNPIAHLLDKYKGVRLTIGVTHLATHWKILHFALKSKLWVHFQTCFSLPQVNNVCLSWIDTVGPPTLKVSKCLTSCLINNSQQINDLLYCGFIIWTSNIYKRSRTLWYFNLNPLGSKSASHKTGVHSQNILCWHFPLKLNYQAWKNLFALGYWFGLLASLISLPHIARGKFYWIAVRLYNYQTK